MSWCSWPPLSRSCAAAHRPQLCRIGVLRLLLGPEPDVEACAPAGQPFRPVVLTFDGLGAGKPRYTARVRHWTVADRERHEQMGFHQGWGICTDQLAALAKRL